MNVYIIESGHLQSNGLMFWYNIEIYSSFVKTVLRLENSFKVNEGYNLTKYSDTNYMYYNYECLSTDGKQMNVYLRYKQVKVN